jgi:hypothetical protein
MHVLTEIHSLLLDLYRGMSLPLLHTRHLRTIVIVIALNGCDPSACPSAHSVYRAVPICRSGTTPCLCLPARMPAQVLLVLLQIRVPQGACERAKHLGHDVLSCASGLPCNAVLQHTAVLACPQCPVDVNGDFAGAAGKTAPEVFTSVLQEAAMITEGRPCW